MSYITKDQLEALHDAEFYSRVEFNRLLEEYTDIEAIPYTAFYYRDVLGNWVGDSDSDDTIEDILRRAYIEVRPNDADKGV